MSETKKGVALKSFRDAGTEKNYEADKVYNFTPGEFENFEHAGLVGEPTAKEAKAPAA